MLCIIIPAINNAPPVAVIICPVIALLATNFFCLAGIIILSLTLLVNFTDSTSFAPVALILLVLTGFFSLWDRFGDSHGRYEQLLQRHATVMRTIYALLYFVLLCYMLRRDSDLLLGVVLFAILLFLHTQRKFLHFRLNRVVFYDIVLFFVVGIVSIAVLEIGARMLFGPPPPRTGGGLFMAHPKYMFLLNSGGSVTPRIQVALNTFVPIRYEISAQGFRDRVFQAKESNEYRVLLLGDSYTMGHAVEASQTIPAHLERLLEASASVPVSVANGGVNGAGPLQALGMLRERGLALQPDAVLLQLFLYNDFDDCLMTVDKAQHSFYSPFRRQVEILQNQSFFPFWLERQLRNKSAVYWQLALKTQLETAWVSDFLTSFRLFAEPRKITQTPLTPHVPPYLDINREHWYPELHEGLELLTHYVEQIQALCHENDIAFAVYCIPHHDEVSTERWRWSVEAARSGLSFERYKAIQRVGTALEAKGVSVVSVLDALGAYETQIDRIYYLYDGHLTPFGNRVVAEVLYAYLHDTHVFDEPLPRHHKTADTTYFIEKE